MGDYDNVQIFWDRIFSKGNVKIYENVDLGQKDLNEAVKWLCAGVESIIDYGCGNGAFLFNCALCEVQHLVGIDISSEGIKLAREIRKFHEKGDFDFHKGSIDILSSMRSHTMDGAILSNIVDNLIPKEADLVLQHIHRIVRINGKIIFKVNPKLTKEQIIEWDIKDLGNDLLLEPTGLYLLNKTTEEWINILGQYFEIYSMKDIYYEQHDQYNRLFLLINK